MIAGSAVISNTTISGNWADDVGGGLYLGDSGDIELNNVTIAENGSDKNADNIGDGGGIFSNRGMLTIQNSIVAHNSDSSVEGSVHPDCSGALGTIISNGYNLIGAADGCYIITAAGDQSGTLASPLNLFLGPLGDYGGPTQTHGLLPNSPAIDAGNPALPSSGGSACEATDQRGVARPIDGDQDNDAICDSGAYEFDFSIPILYLPLLSR
jgi:hypothetical protein